MRSRFYNDSVRELSGGNAMSRAITVLGAVTLLSGTAVAGGFRKRFSADRMK